MIYSCLGKKTKKSLILVLNACLKLTWAILFAQSECIMQTAQKLLKKNSPKKQKMIN